MIRAVEVHAVVNPAAAGGRAGTHWPRIAGRLREVGWQLQEHFTTGPESATRIARELLRQGVVELLAVGGDGTVHEIVNGISSAGAAPRNPATLSVMPLGTGRDFARNLGIHSVRDAIAALASDSVAEIDLGRAVLTDAAGMRQRRFVNVVTTGLGASVAGRVQRSTQRLGGSAAYLFGTLRELLSMRTDPATVSIDGRVVHEGPLALTLILNGRCCGGGMVPAPEASMCDGLLDTLVCRPLSRASLALGLLPQIYRGRPVQHPAVSHARGSSVHIRAERSAALALDGEPCSCADLHLTVEMAALRVRVPPAAPLP